MSAGFVAVPLEGTLTRNHHREPVAVPRGLELRGFGLYVGLDEASAQAAGVDIEELVGDVRRALTEIPGAATFASVVLAPEGAPGSALEVVRTALGEPTVNDVPVAPSRAPRAGVVIDLARHRVSVDGTIVHFSYREQALLEHFVRNQGVVLDRQNLLAALSSSGGDEELGERTIDVYLQRLRRRLTPYGDVIRTVRGRGYRIDPHPDVTIISDARITPE